MLPLAGSAPKPTSGQLALQRTLSCGLGLHRSWEAKKTHIYIYICCRVNNLAIFGGFLSQ